jgi:hypothetical protein
METLARLTPISITPMARLLHTTSGALPWGATLLLISAITTDSTRAALLRQRERGRDVVWLFLGDGPAPRAPGILVRHAPQRGDWRGNGYTKNREPPRGYPTENREFAP